MSIRELREQLAKYPDDMQVFIAERKTEFTYGLVNSVSVKNINFTEEPNSLIIATDDVVVLDEE